MPLYMIERNFAEQLQLSPEANAAIKHRCVGLLLLQA